MSNWTTNKILDFINEIRLNPAVWDVESKEYRDRKNRKEGWVFIADKFNITSEEAYKKFRSLRTYAKNEEKKRRSGSAGGKQSAWFAYEAISFVLSRDISDLGIESKNIIDGDNILTENLEIIVGDSGVTSDSGLSSSPANSQTEKRKPKRGAYQQGMRLNKAVNFINEASMKRKNEYSCFGEHIANKLMKYDKCTRANVEFQINKILYEADMKTFNAISTNSLPTIQIQSPTSSKTSYTVVTSPSTSTKEESVTTDHTYQIDWLPNSKSD